MPRASAAAARSFARALPMRASISIQTSIEVPMATKNGRMIQSNSSNCISFGLSADGGKTLIRPSRTGLNGFALRAVHLAETHDGGESFPPVCRIAERQQRAETRQD